MNFHLLGLLLVASLIVNGGHSLQCYQCSSTKNNTVCNAGGPTLCNPQTDSCIAVLDYRGSDVFIEKRCLRYADCSIDRLKFIFVVSKFTFNCCQSDGCNVNAAPPRLLSPGHAAVALLGLGASVASWALM